MIVGQFSESYPPAIDGVGGVMLNYCRELDRRGHRSIYIAPENKNAGPIPDVETMLYKSMKTPASDYHVGFPAMQPSFMEELRDVPFDLVHAHAPFMAGWLARSLAREKHIPLVATFHSKYYDDAYRVTHSRTLSRQLVKMVLDFYDDCDEVWAVSERTAEVLRSYGYRGPIVIMPNGIDPSEQREPGDITDLGLRSSALQLLFVGQQDYKKGTREIIRSAALLKEAGIDFQLVMVGEGMDRHALQNLTRELQLTDRIQFTGRIVDRGRLMALYRNADLFVFPSVYDNAPLVVREAALQGTASVVVEGSCAAEGIAHGENGYLCDGTAEGIAGAILEALPTAKEAGERASRTIPVTWEKIGAGIEERYLRLIRDRR